jgi:hypothetical protein
MMDSNECAFLKYRDVVGGYLGQGQQAGQVDGPPTDDKLLHHRLGTQHLIHQLWYGRTVDKKLVPGTQGNG